MTIDRICQESYNGIQTLNWYSMKLTLIFGSLLNVFPDAGTPFRELGVWGTRYVAAKALMHCAH